jgi:hypothetical protein
LAVRQAVVVGIFIALVGRSVAVSVGAARSGAALRACRHAVVVIVGVEIIGIGVFVAVGRERNELVRP